MEKKSVYNMISEINEILCATIPKVMNYENATDMEKVKQKLNNNDISVTLELENMSNKLADICKNENLKKSYKTCPEVYEQCRDFIEEMEKELQKLLHILTIYKDNRQVEKKNLDFVKISATMEVLLNTVTEYKQNIKNILPNIK